MEDRATYTLVIHRLTYAELWRLANRSLFGFALLLEAKWFKSGKFDHTKTTIFRPVLLNDPVLPAILQDRFTSARAQLDALGFRYIGTDDEIFRAGGCVAYFMRGPVVALQLVFPRLSYVTLTSFPPDRLRISTANGRAFIDCSARHDMAVLPGSTRLAALVEHHNTRIAPLALPDLTLPGVIDELEKLAREACAHQLARGIFVPQPLAPPLLSAATPGKPG